MTSANWAHESTWPDGMQAKVPGGLSNVIARPPSPSKDFDQRRFLMTGKKPICHICLQEGQGGSM